MGEGDPGDGPVAEDDADDRTGPQGVDAGVPLLLAHAEHPCADSVVTIWATHSRVTVSGPALCNPLPEIDDPRRAEVISQISSDLGIVTVDSSVRALLWLADVEALETLLEGCKRSPSVFRLLFVQGSDLTNHALGAC